MSRIIRTLHNPEIILSDMIHAQTTEFAPSENSTGYPFVTANNKTDFSKEIGLRAFAISLNGFSLDKNVVNYCLFDNTKKYPTITLRISPNPTDFVAFALPKDGDIISIFYRSTVQELKPIRCDFVVVECFLEGGLSWVIYGVLNIPNYFSDSSFSINDTSINTIKEVSKKLKLGFATNETETTDKQNWVCASKPIDVYIEDILLHSWKNEKSFFDSYIDMYYVLNYVNVWEQLTNEIDKKVSVGLYKFRDFIESDKNVILYQKNQKDEDELLGFETPIVLNNWMHNAIKENSISNIRIMNESSRISLENGYKKYVHFFDYMLNEKVEIPTQSITSKGSTKDYLLFRGRLGDNTYKAQNRHTWAGISYNLPDHNTHQFYKIAEEHNSQNIREIDKFTIEVTLDAVNFNIYRYMVVPVIIYEYGEAVRKFLENRKGFSTLDDNEIPFENVPYIINQNISGFYIVKGFYIDYEGGMGLDIPKVKQRLILSRTEHPKFVTIPNIENAYVTNINVDTV